MKYNLKSPTGAEAEERYRQFVADEELREEYQDRIKAERDRRSRIIYAERQGEKRGLKQGLERGRLEERQGLVQRMKSRGMSTEEIADFTGMSAEEIDAIV